MRLYLVFFEDLVRPINSMFSMYLYRIRNRDNLVVDKASKFVHSTRLPVLLAGIWQF